jgi:hypothetical protein
MNMKSNLLKVISSTTLALALITPCVFAESINQSTENTQHNIQKEDKSQKITKSIKTKKGKVVDFIIKKELEDKVTDAELNAIASQNENGGTVTIHEIVIEAVNKPTSNPSSSTEIQPLAKSYTDTVKLNQVVSTDNPYAAVQVISVAKGQTVKLTSSRTFTNNLTFSASGTVPSGAQATLGLNPSFSKTYTTEQTFAGPPESSSAISRVYYHTAFYNYINWKIQRVWSDGASATYSGTAQEPMNKYLLWSNDVK